MSKGKERNSLLYWYPKVKDVVETPKTVALTTSRLQCVERLERGEIEEEFMDKMRDCASDIGYPLFLRTDHTSGKHEYKNTCYVKDEEVLKLHTFRLIEYSEMAGILGLPLTAFVFRELLDLRHDFTAFEGFPVGWELRCFIRDGEIECIHNYWPQAAISFPSITDWKERWEEMHRWLMNEGKKQVEPLVKKVAGVLDGYWSVDFALTKEGGWVMIDAALGEVSYHWATCPHNPEREQQIEQEAERAQRNENRERAMAQIECVFKDEEIEE